RTDALGDLLDRRRLVAGRLVVGLDGEGRHPALQVAHWPHGSSVRGGSDKADRPGSAGNVTQRTPAAGASIRNFRPTSPAIPRTGARNGPYVVVGPDPRPNRLTDEPPRRPTGELMATNKNGVSSSSSDTADVEGARSRAGWRISGWKLRNKI